MYIDMDCPCQGKNLDKLLQPLILCILAEGGDMHGFAILKEIGKVPRFSDKIPDATGVYRYLKKWKARDFLLPAGRLRSLMIRENRREFSVSLMMENIV